MFPMCIKSVFESINSIRHNDIVRKAFEITQLNNISLELRRLHNDLLWCYKIAFGLVDITCDDFFPVMYLVSNEGTCIQAVYTLYKLAWKPFLC